MIEVLVVISIVGILAAFVLASAFNVTGRARDARRKAEITQIGKFLILSCYLPDEYGEGKYDLISLVNKILIKYPQQSKFLSNIPKDPKTGTETESRYVYTVTDDGKKCALYANLENSSEAVTLSITVPTPGGGIGVLEANSSGWNGSPLYFQYSN